MSNLSNFPSYLSLISISTILVSVKSSSQISGNRAFMLNSPLRISLGSPVYNGDFLEDRLESLLKQSFTDF